MIVLQDGNETLELVLDAATATSALTYYASFVDHKGSPVTDTQIGQSNSLSNGTTAVTLVQAPSQSPTATKRQIKYISVYNGDSSPAVVTTRINDNGTIRVLSRLTLLQGERMEYMADDGFQVRMADGGLRTQATIPYTVTQLKNQIINGNFDIWQRATSRSASTGVIYTADRWLFAAGGSTCAPSRQNFTLGQTDVPGEPRYYHRNVIASVAGANNFVQFAQRIEGVRTFAGQTVTFSFYAKADAAKPISIEFYQSMGTGGSPSADVSGIDVQKITLSTSWQKYSVTANIPSISGKTLGTNNDDCFAVVFWMDSGSTFAARNASLGQQSGTFDFAQVQLEAGSLATSFDVRPLSVELAFCQRYYEKSYDVATVPGTAPVLNGAVSHTVVNLPSASYTVGVQGHYMTRKRAAPTVTFYSTQTGAAGFVRDGSGGADIVPTLVTSGETGFNFQATVATSNQFVVRAHFAADAEL